MNTTMKKMIGLLSLTATFGMVDATLVINGNFCSSANVSGTQGAAGLNSGTFWNGLTQTPGGFLANDNTSSLNFSDGSTSVTGMNIAWTSTIQDGHDDRNDTGFEVTTGHEELMAGYLLGAETTTLSGTNVLSAFKNQPTYGGTTSYDLYLYIDADSAANVGTYSVTLTSGLAPGFSTVYGNDGDGSGGETDFIANSNGGLTEFVQATSTLSTDPTDGSNYVLISGITSEDFTVTIEGLSGNSALNGFEITAIPEPGTMALAGILLGSFGGLQLVRRRKR